MDLDHVFVFWALYFYGLRAQANAVTPNAKRFAQLQKALPGVYTAASY